MMMWIVAAQRVVMRMNLPVIQDAESAGRPSAGRGAASLATRGRGRGRGGAARGRSAPSRLRVLTAKAAALAANGGIVKRRGHGRGIGLRGKASTGRGVLPEIKLLLPTRSRSRYNANPLLAFTIGYLVRRSDDCSMLAARTDKAVRRQCLGKGTTQACASAVERASQHGYAATRDAL